MRVLKSEALEAFEGRQGLSTLLNVMPQAVDHYEEPYLPQRPGHAVLWAAVRRWGMAGTVERFTKSFVHADSWRNVAPFVWKLPGPCCPPDGVVAVFKSRHGLRVSRAWPNAANAARTPHSPLEDSDGELISYVWGECICYTDLADFE